MVCAKRQVHTVGALCCVVWRLCQGMESLASELDSVWVLLGTGHCFMMKSDSLRSRLESMAFHSQSRWAEASATQLKGLHRFTWHCQVGSTAGVIGILCRPAPKPHLLPCLELGHAGRVHVWQRAGGTGQGATLKQRGTAALASLHGVSAP